MSNQREGLYVCPQIELQGAGGSCFILLSIKGMQEGACIKER